MLLLLLLFVISGMMTVRCGLLLLVLVVLAGGWASAARQMAEADPQLSAGSMPISDILGNFQSFLIVSRAPAFATVPSSNRLCSLRFYSNFGMSNLH